MAELRQKEDTLASAMHSGRQKIPVQVPDKLRYRTSAKTSVFGKALLAVRRKGRMRGGRICTGVHRIPQANKKKPLAKGNREVYARARLNRGASKTSRINRKRAQ